MMDNLEFATLIRHRRLEMRLSQPELARRANISPSYVAWLEKGKRVPSLATSRQLAQALDLSEDEILKAAGRVPKEDAVRLNPEEQELLQQYRQAQQPLRSMLRSALRSGLESQREQSRDTRP